MGRLSNILRKQYTDYVMRKNIKLIYTLIEKDLKEKGWDDVSIAEAKAECQRERLATGADNKTLCVKEMSYLSQESLQIVARQLVKKDIREWIKPVISKVSTGFKLLKPYMSLIAVILCLVNFLYLMKIQSNIEDLQYRVDEVHYSVRNPSRDYDNSDVIDAIEDAESNIIGSVDIAREDIINSVEDAKNELEADIIIYRN